MGTVTEGKALSKRKPNLRGTEGSNPVPSSGESGTNRTPSLRGRRSIHQLDRYRRDIRRLGRQRRYGFDCDVRGMICPGSKAETREDGNMRRSLTRIRTSHVGRLPPPKGWADMPARLAGAEITDPVVIAAKVTPAIAETVKKQIEAGIDCIGDGVNHPVFKDKPVNYAPREVWVRDLFTQRSEYNAFHEYYRALVEALYKAKVSRNVYCVNIDAVISALLLKILWR